MQAHRRILVGLDAGPNGVTAGSRAALRQACWLAERTGARVDVLHSDFRDAETGYDGEPVPDWSALDEHWGECGEGVERGEFVSSEDRPWVAITKRVLRGENDLVVVGRRNEALHDHPHMGSVSWKLVRKCPAPVWVVHPGQDPEHRAILAATDLSPVGDLAVEYAAFLASELDARLHVVHAWQMPMDLQLASARMAPEEVERRKREIIDAAREHIHAVRGVDTLEERLKIWIGRDSPSHAVLEACEESDADLVVMGTVSRGGLAGVLVGNTAEKLLARINRSLLTVKPAEFVCPLTLD